VRVRYSDIMATLFDKARYETALARIAELPAEGDPETGETPADIAREALGWAVCLSCEEVYNEGTGEGYNGLCPSCADASEPVCQHPIVNNAGQCPDCGVHLTIECTICGPDAPSGYDDWGED
jgi:hypothetical protein